MIIPTNQRDLLCPLYPLLFSQSFLEPPTDFIKFVPVTDPLCTPCNQQQLLIFYVLNSNMLDIFHQYSRFSPSPLTPKLKIYNIENSDRYDAIQQTLGVFQKQRTKEYLKAAQVWWWWRVGTNCFRGQRKRQNCSHYLYNSNYYCC